MFETIVTILHILVCLLLLLAVLLQSGKGGGVSAAFGGGAGAAMGQAGAATVLGKTTGFAAATFMVTSMILAVYSSPSVTDPTKDFADKSGIAAAAAEANKTKEAPAKAETPKEAAKPDAPKPATPQ